MIIPEILGSGLLLIILFVTGYVSLKIKIPEVILFILLGIALGGLLSGSNLLHFVGEVGIVLLFFMLGMEFPIRQLMTVAKKVSIAGTLDVILSLGITMVICIVMGVEPLMAFLIGSVVYATSSSITAKLLESYKRMANPEAEFMLGLLIFEDLVAPVLVAILVGLTAGGVITFSALSLVLFKVVGLTAGAILIGSFVFSKLDLFFDRYMNSDIFIMFIIGIALSYGGLALWLGLSEVLGAFLAGVIIAEVRRNEHLESIIVPIRDLTLPLFFLYYGTTIKLGEGVPMIGLLLVLLAWSIVGKLIVGFYGGRWYGLTPRGALRAGFSLIQRGEFSIIIASLAVGSIKIFSSIYILVSSMVGIGLFIAAPKISSKIYGKTKEKKKVKLPC